MNLTKYWKGQYIICVSQKLIEELLKSPHYKRPSLVVDPNCITWDPQPKKIPRLTKRWRPSWSCLFVCFCEGLLNGNWKYPLVSSSLVDRIWSWWTWVWMSRSPGKDWNCLDVFCAISDCYLLLLSVSFVIIFLLLIKCNDLCVQSSRHGIDFK